MRNGSFVDYPSGDEPGPRVPALPNAGCLLPDVLWFVELLLDDELGEVDVTVGSDVACMS
jgi:hypothetical protein